MDLVKITDLTNQLGLTSRSLRYYEQVGLIQSVRSGVERYRYYNADTVERLKQIIVLRKMQIPIKDILRIYEREDTSTLVEVFVDRLHAIEEQQNALTELKNIVSEFLQSMLQHGITKISALPLLYDEMEKQLKGAQKENPFNMSQLTAISEKLESPPQIRLTALPNMRVISSRFKHDPQKTDPDGFWFWLQKNNIPMGLPGNREQFECQTSAGDIVFLRVNDSFVNNSPFLDYTMEGGVYAVTDVYLDENLPGRLQACLSSFQDNPYYEIDYRHDGGLRHEPLLEPLLSPDEHRELAALYIPVKKRMADAANFEKGRLLNQVDLPQLEGQNPVVWVKEVDILSLTPRENSKLVLLEEGAVKYVQHLWPGVLPTGVFVKVPFRVDVVFRARWNSLYLIHGNGMMKLNAGYSNDHSRHRHSVMLRQPVFGDELCFDQLANVDSENWNTASWIVGEKYMACVLNGERKACLTDAPYMKLNPQNHTPLEVVLGSDQDNANHDLVLKSIKITQLAQKKRRKIKKGELTMITKQSNNILPDLHALVTWHYGENYVFDACMRFLMERVGAKEPILADFDFFGGISGDTIVQVYGHGFERSYNCHDIPLSSVWDGPELVSYVFEEIGYEHTYVTADQIKQNSNMYTETLKAYIDKGIPVLARTAVPFGYGSNFELIVGYEENGKVLLYLDGDSTEPRKVTVGERIGGVWQIEWDWVFIGAQKRQVDGKRLYRNCLHHALQLLTSPDRYGCSFGAKAFRDWAHDVENGWFASEHEYTTYVCLLATNGRAWVTFDRILKACPDDTFLNSLIDIYKNKCQVLWNELEGLGGGFNVTLEIMQDSEQRKRIADKIREFAIKMDEVVSLLKANLPEEKTV